MDYKHSINSNYTTCNVADQQNDANSLWSTYRDIIKLRSENEALSKGTYQAIDSSPGNVFSFIRQYSEEVLIVLMNFSGGNLNTPILNAASSNISPGEYLVEDITGQYLDLDNLIVEDNGIITDWTPISTLSGRNTYILKLTRL